MKTGSSRRVMRYEKELRQLASQFFITRVNEPNIGIPSVSRVFISGDLKSAKVFIHFMQSETPELDLLDLERYLPELQHFIHRSLRSKYCPKIKLILDESYEQVLKVEKLLHEIEKSREEVSSHSEE